MRIQVKARGAVGTKRIDSHKAIIENVVVKENLIDSNKERVVIYFKGRESSGILHFGLKEITELIETIKPYSSLVKNKKTFK